MRETRNGDQMRWRTLAGTAAAVSVTAAVGGLASSTGARSDWYERLSKPAFQPPPAAFPVAWTALYADIAGVSAVVIDELEDAGEHRRAAAYRRALAANLALNASWTWVFFRAHRLAPAVLVAGALTVSSADLARRAGAAGRGRALALAPYVGWCAFATVLSESIRRRNRG